MSWLSSWREKPRRIVLLGFSFFWGIIPHIFPAHKIYTFSPKTFPCYWSEIRFLQLSLQLPTSSSACTSFLFWSRKQSSGSLDKRSDCTLSISVSSAAQSTRPASVPSQPSIADLSSSTRIRQSKIYAVAFHHWFLVRCFFVLLGWILNANLSKM